VTWRRISDLYDWVCLEASDELAAGPVPPGELSAIMLARSVVVQEEDEVLEEALRARVTAGREAWPNLPLDDRTFVTHVGDRVHRGALPPLAYAADLWLACACRCGVPTASAEFDRIYRPVVARAVAKIARSDADDTTQQVLVAMLAGREDQPPRLTEYGGRASLRTWLSTVSARTALKRARRSDAKAHDSVSALADVATRGEPELRIARERYASDLQEALRTALASLEARQRVLLRMHHVDHWPLERVGEMYRVSRATAGRWLAEARVALFAATKERLRRRHRLTDTEVESLLRELQSGLLEVSMIRLLDEERRG
jgi:RNA polymerase sigma-70 factor (ECF subfamily)